jgi:putative serine protease PepD
VALALLAAAGLLGTGWFGSQALTDDAGTTAQPAAAVVQQPTQPGQPTPPVAPNTDEPAEAVATALGPAVVQIERGDGLGAGVVYDAEGLVITNAHVVGDASEVDVRFSDGDKRAGTVVGADPSSDIAVIRLDDASGLTVARLATDNVRVGQSVFALGSPFGLQSTVTAGIVSAVDRPVDGEQGVAINMIQTDAPINPGNSGGALANRAGEIVGINTAIFSEKGENNGIGFSIPIGTAKSVADRIVSGQPLTKGYLGVRTSTPTDGSAGALVAQVDEGTPAAEAGLTEGDVIVAVDGQVLRGSQDLSARILAMAPGDTVTLEVERDGGAFETEVTLGSRPESSPSSSGGTTPDRGSEDDGSGSPTRPR